MASNLFEGGNVFKNADGSPATQRISQRDIPATVAWLERLTGLDLSRDKDENGIPIKWLGSTGKKADSGDLDLAVDANEITKANPPLLPGATGANAPTVVQAGNQVTVTVYWQAPGASNPSNHVAVATIEWN